MPDNAVDLVITDPPYGVNVIGGSKPFGKRGSIGGSHIVDANQYKPITNDDKTLDLSELFRISKNQIIFGGHFFPFPTSRGWIVWDKKTKNGWNDNFGDGELIWTSFDRPLKIFRFLYMGMLQEGKREKRVHPTQKPVALMKWILENYSKESDTILDPFAGSGSTLIACKILGRKYLGVEIDSEYCAIAEKRIAEML